MSQMGIRPPVTFLDSNGNPAVDFRVFISQPFTDPKDESKQLVITDSASGEVVSNPFTITMDGYPKNADGQRINPVIQEQNYAILFESIGGGQQDSHQNITGDAFGVSAATTAMVDRVLNNFQSALALDMTGNNFIFIQSQTSGWEGTTAGPINSYYAYYTGGEGSPGTGIFDLFFDAGGNEWEIADISSRPLVNELNIATNSTLISINTPNIATNTADIATNTAVLANGVVDLSTGQSVNGVKSFTSPVGVVDGVAPGDAANLSQLPDPVFYSEIDLNGALVAGSFPAGFTLVKRPATTGIYDIDHDGSVYFYGITPRNQIDASGCIDLVAPPTQDVVRIYNTAGVSTDTGFYLSVKAL